MFTKAQITKVAEEIRDGKVTGEAVKNALVNCRRISLEANQASDSIIAKYAGVKGKIDSLTPNQIAEALFAIAAIAE